MGYTTTFEGAFTLSKPLTEVQAKELFVYASKRHDNEPGCPGVWCNWKPLRDSRDKWRKLAWNGAEKFYDYVEWLYTLDAEFFSRWGITVTGSVKFQGERPEERGTISAKNGQFTVKSRKVGYIHKW